MKQTKTIDKSKKIFHDECILICPNNFVWKDKRKGGDTHASKEKEKSRKEKDSNKAKDKEKEIVFCFDLCEINTN